MSTITDSELDKYATGRRLLSLLRLREPYIRLLRAHHDKYGKHAATVAHELAPGDAQVAETLREELLRIAGYEIWVDLLSDKSISRRLLQLGMILSGFGVVLATVIFATDPPFPGPWWQFLLIAAVTAALVVLLVFALTDLQSVDTDGPRTITDLLVMTVIVSGGILLALWRSFWGVALSGGILFTSLALLLMPITAGIAGKVARATYHRAWNRWTAAEIMDTLVYISWILRYENERSSRGQVAVQLEHVANRMERSLPHYLARSAETLHPDALIRGVQSRFDEMAAAMRKLAHDYLTPGPSTHQSTSDEVARLTIYAAQGYWGEWIRTPVAEDHIRWRPWRERSRQVFFKILPIIVALAAIIALSVANPTSPPFDADVTKTVIGVALGVITDRLLPRPDRKPIP